MSITKMQKRLLITFFIFSISTVAGAQCPTASYNLPDTVCAGVNFSISGSPSSSSSYKWDFCIGDLYSTPVGMPDYAGIGTSLGNDIVQDNNGNWFVFAAYTAGISRFDYGTSPTNAPTMTNLGNVGGIMGSSADIKIMQDNGNWYGIVCHWDNRVTRLSFGDSLTNTPIARQMVVPTAVLGKPYNLDLVYDNGNYVALTANQDSINVGVINFGTTLENDTPTVSKVAVPGAQLVGVAAVKDCDEWFVFTTSLNIVGIQRIEFGNSLSNAPTNVTTFNSVGDASGNWNFNICREGDRWIGLANGLTVLKRFDFGTSLHNTPVYSATPGYVGTGLARGLTVRRFGSRYYGANTDYFAGTRVIVYPDLCTVSPQISDSLEVSNISYSAGGWKFVSLLVTDSLGNVEQIMDSVHVLPLPDSKFGIDKSCRGEPVQFSDSSTVSGSTISGWMWDFGDGTTSNIQNPVHTYNTPGMFPVALTTSSSAGCSNTLFDTLTVNIPPTARFSFPDSTCGNMGVTFGDSSSSQTGTITGWGWFFGDTQGANQQHPVHQYSSSGNYTVQLYVVDDGGCQDDTSRTLTIIPAPVAGFDVSNTCFDHATQFINESDSNLSVISSYFWDFADGNTSNIADPTNNYAGPSALYNVMLVANSTNGCSDTTVAQVQISDVPVPDFSTSRDSACTNNPIVFSSTSVPMPGDTIIKYHWDFDDGTTSDQQVISHSFASPGTYSVTLTVTTPFSCDSSITKEILASPSPNADFTFTQVCEGSGTVFNDLSSPQGPVALSDWYWQFGDTLTDSIQNPVHTYGASGTYSVTLMTIDDLGCSDTVTKSINVYGVPNAMYTYSHACTDTVTTFTDLSTVINGTISAWSWDFGDASTSDWKNPKHGFDPAGIYVVELIVETSDGCTDTAFQGVEIFAAPQGNFNASATCIGEITSFNFVSVITPSPVSTWFWLFGDGGNSTIEDPAHFYLSAGNYPVVLTITDTGTGCSSIIKKTVTVNSIPGADFSYTGTCENSIIQFTDLSTVSGGVISNWLWRFGDGDTSILQNPDHVYQSAGSYTVTLLVNSPEGCVDSVSKTVEIYPEPTAAFSVAPGFGSPPLAVSFSNTSTGAVNYLWDFGDGNTSNSTNPSNVYNNLGLYHPQLIAISAQGCTDTISSVVNVLDQEIDLAILDISSTLSGNTYALSAILINLGNIEITSFNISAQLQSNGELFETWNGKLLPNQTLLYEFGSSLINWNVSPEFYCVSIDLIPSWYDDNLNNNKRCKSFSGEFNILQVFPNPFHDQFNLLLQAPENGEVLVDIFDASGKQLLKTMIIPVMSGINTKLINAQTFGSGLYYLKARMGDEEQDILIFKD